MASSHAYELKETLLKASNISLSFGNNVVLKDVNVEVKDIVRPGIEQGQIIGFLGPSGIGKTLFSEILAGIRKPTTGEVLVGSNQAPVEIGRVGMVQQKYPLFYHRDVWDNLQIVADLKIKDKKLRKEKIDNFLTRFGLIQHKKKYPAQLSGGQKQRLAIIQALLACEDILIMDEPFSGLDVNMLNEVSSVLSELASLNELLTIIVISHDVTATTSISDTLWVMGRDRDINGNIIPGAKIKHHYDLLDLDLAWHKNMTADPRFLQLTTEIKALFKNL